MYNEWEEIKNAYKILVENSEGTRPLGRLRYVLEYHVKMNFIETFYHVNACLPDNNILLYVFEIKIE
jgi:hypothetical protein